VTELVIVWAANVPLAKFKIHKVGVDLIFADFQTPSKIVNQDYFL
jgi:poly(A) polymerase Pap1